MARVTVEDCMYVVENRFELAVLASQRAKDICAGAKLTIERENDKNAVIALREIAQKKISCSLLTDKLIEKLQKKRSKFDLNEDSANKDINYISEEEIEMEFNEDISCIANVKDFDINNNDDYSFEDEDGDIESEN